MTISSTSTTELSIDKIVKLALNTAGILPPGAPQSGTQWNNLATQARDFLEIITDHLPTKTRLDRAISFYEIAMTAEDGEYDLPNTTLGVVGNGMYLSENETDGETVVRQVSRDDYFSISDKAATGRPTLMYIQRHETLSVFLWPVPVDAGALTIQRQALLADCGTGTNKPDLERYWNEYLLYELAHKIALGNSVAIQRCGYIRSQADKALENCKKLSTQQGPIQMISTHGSSWSK